MGKRKKKKGFAEKHPFITLATLPVSFPAMVAAEALKPTPQKRGGAKKYTANVKSSSSSWHYFSGTEDYDTLKGHDFEYFCERILKKNGFTSTRVTRGSGDQGGDVIGEKDGKRYVFQCKRYSGHVGNKAVQEAHTAKAYYRCQEAVVLTNNYYTSSAKELASAIGVQLWDRDDLKRLVRNANASAPRQVKPVKNAKSGAKTGRTDYKSKPNWRKALICGVVLFLLVGVIRGGEKEETEEPKEEKRAMALPPVETKPEHSLKEQPKEIENGKQISSIVIDEVTYKLMDGYSIVMRVTSKGKELQTIDIKQDINGYPVTEICDRAFYQCDELKSITLPDSIDSIGVSAFEECRALQEINIPSGITTIQGSSFAKCNSLEHIDIPEGVTEIQTSAFANCGFTSVSLPNTLQSIGETAFYSCSRLESISVPEGVLKIGEKAFKNNRSLTSVSLPDSLSEIGDSAFWGCKSLKEITIPPNVPELDYSMFVYAESLKTVRLPKSCKIQSGDCPFSGCYDVKVIKY